MDRRAANWFAVIEKENEVPLFVRKSSNDIQLGKVARLHYFSVPIVAAAAVTALTASTKHQ